MALVSFLLLVIVLPSDCWAYVPHEYPAIYTQQLGRVFLFIAFLVVLSSIVHYRLYREKGWRYLFVSLIFFAVWDLDVFVGRLSELITIPRTIGGTEGWQYFERHIEIAHLEYLYFIGRLDFVLLNVAMFLFYLGLKEHLSEVRKDHTVSAAVVLPLLPVLITDIAGNGIFIVISVMSLYTSIQLYKTDRGNVLWNYMVWLAVAWFMFSVSRSFGHILRHILIPTGNEDIWKIFEPITGSFNTFSLFFVGSVSLFFIRIYKSYMEITNDKIQLERLVTERTQLIACLEQDKMQLQELDKLKSAFLANMSHELRTPMNTIIGYTEALLDKVDGPVNAEQEKSLGKVKQSAKHLLKLIDDVLDVSRLESGKVRLVVTKVDLKALIESILPSFEETVSQKGLTVSLALDEDLPPVYGDEVKIKQILMNLFSNAVKFTHRGRIAIRVHPMHDKKNSDVLPDFMEICISDTGIGIKEEDLRKIFDTFVQIDFTLVRQYEGTGLGLSIASGLVGLHKGTIWATSTYGEGSTFCFTLPLKKEIFAETQYLI
jgi:signal transduction histidine kinase